MKLRSEGLTWQEIDGELVILDLKNSVYLTTNAAGAVIAKLLTEERTVDELSGASGRQIRDRERRRPPRHRGLRQTAQGQAAARLASMNRPIGRSLEPYDEPVSQVDPVSLRSQARTQRKSIGRLSHLVRRSLALVWQAAPRSSCAARRVCRS